MSQPLVTIIAVCYNQVKWVKQTLDSILKQSYQNIQLIVADDGSTDGSKDIIRQWMDQNNKDTVFIDHPKNLGLTKNINSAIPFVKGDYYQVFGCDDIMLPDKISKQVKMMEEDKQISIVYSDMYLMDIDGKDFGLSYYQRNKHKKPGSGWLYNDLVDRIIISAPSVLIRTNVLKELRGYNEALDFEDYEFFLRASRKFQFYYDEDKTIYYRITGSSLSTAKHEKKYFKNLFIIFYQNFDSSSSYKKIFNKKLLFAFKNLYAFKSRNTFILGIKGFIKTGDINFLKFGIAGIRYLITGVKI